MIGRRRKRSREKRVFKSKQAELSSGGWIPQAARRGCGGAVVMGPGGRWGGGAPSHMWTNDDSAGVDSAPLGMVEYTPMYTLWQCCRGQAGH